MVCLITCDSCYLHFIGETVQILSAHFKGHSLGFKYPEKIRFGRILAEQFNRENC